MECMVNDSWEYVDHLFTCQSMLSHFRIDPLNLTDMADTTSHHTPSVVDSPRDSSSFGQRRRSRTVLRMWQPAIVGNLRKAASCTKPPTVSPQPHLVSPFLGRLLAANCSLNCFARILQMSHYVITG